MQSDFRRQALGILSNDLASQLPHGSIALEEIQQRRSRKSIPGGGSLHSYANLYLHARNPMLYRRKEDYRSICILRVHPDVLDLPGAIITSQNASSDYVRFYPSPKGLDFLDRDLVFAELWTHNDQIEEWRRKSIKCAEILIPDKVEAKYIVGAYVSTTIARLSLEAMLRQANLRLSVTVNGPLFFRR